VLGLNPIINRVIIVEDDPATRDSISLAFEIGFQGVDIVQFDRLAPVIEAIASHKPDLITLDLGLPDGDGIQLVRKIREISDLPILILSGRGDDSSILTAIRMGADDFLVKPFSTIELQAHVEALMRRVKRLEVGPVHREISLRPNLSLDLPGARLIKDGIDIPLSAREVECLSLLVEADGKIVTTKEFKERVWRSTSVTDAAVKMVFYRLRKSLGDDESDSLLIQSHRGIGYSLGR
jgi:two-component system, OmpR family, KDP operon response regulator KdpE